MSQCNDDYALRSSFFFTDPVLTGRRAHRRLLSVGEAGTCGASVRVYSITFQYCVRSRRDAPETVLVRDLEVRLP